MGLKHRIKQLIIMLLACTPLAAKCQQQGGNAAVYYFPAAGTHADAGLDDFLIKWYSGQLLAMKEPVIYNDTSRKEIYRFTWLRSFHQPVAVRMEKDGDRYTLYWKMCDGAGGYEPGDLVTDKQKALDKATCDAYMALLDKTGFAKMPTAEAHGGNDGAEWILEGKTPAAYHVVHRWTPMGRADDFYQACDYLLQQTDLKIKRGDKY